MTIIYVFYKWEFMNHISLSLHFVSSWSASSFEHTKTHSFWNSYRWNSNKLDRPFHPLTGEGVKLTIFERGLKVHFKNLSKRNKKGSDSGRNHHPGKRWLWKGLKYRKVLSLRGSNVPRETSLNNLRRMVKYIFMG